MIKRFLASAVMLLTSDITGMNGSLSPFFKDINRENISDNVVTDDVVIKRSNSCPGTLGVSKRCRARLNGRIPRPSNYSVVKPKSQSLQLTRPRLGRSKSKSDLSYINKRDNVFVKVPPRCKSTNNFVSNKAKNPINESFGRFGCSVSDFHEKSIVFLCMRHCKDKANINNTTHSHSDFNQFDISALDPSEVNLLKILGEMLNPTVIFGGSPSRYNITASLLRWELKPDQRLNEQNLGHLRGLPIYEVIKHHSFQKMISDANCATDSEGESGNQILAKLRSFLNDQKEEFREQHHIFIPLISSNCTLNWFARLITGNSKLKPMIIPNLGAFVFQFFPETGVVEYVAEKNRKNLRIFELSELLPFISQCPTFHPFINRTPVTNAETIVNGYNRLGNFSSNSSSSVGDLLDLFDFLQNQNPVTIRNIRRMLVKSKIS